MRRRMVTGLLIGWLFGIATGLLGVAVTGGWYEHHFFPATESNADFFRHINEEGWEIVPHVDAGNSYMRRPRLRLGW